MAIREGVNMLQFCSVSNSLSHTTLSIKWEVYFSKELCCSSLLCRRYDSACICICVCIVGHGYATPFRLTTVKPKESEKRDKYIELAREMKKLWNMKVILIPIVTGKLGSATKELIRGPEGLEIRGRTETIQTTVLLRSARILRRVLETN